MQHPPFSFKKRLETLSIVARDGERWEEGNRCLLNFAIRISIKEDWRKMNLN